MKPAKILFCVFVLMSIISCNENTVRETENVVDNTEEVTIDLDIKYSDVMNWLSNVSEEETTVLYQDIIADLNAFDSEMFEIENDPNYAGVFDEYANKDYVQYFLNADWENAFISAKNSIHENGKDSIACWIFAQSGDYANHLDEVDYYNVCSSYSQEIAKVMQFSKEMLENHFDNAIPYLNGYFLSLIIGKDGLGYLKKAAELNGDIAIIFAYLGFQASNIDWENYIEGLEFQVKAYKYALTKNENCYSARHNLAFLNYQYQYDYEESLNWAWSAIKISPMSMNVQEIAGFAYGKLGYGIDYIYQDMKEKSDDPMVYFSWTSYIRKFMFSYMMNMVLKNEDGSIAGYMGMDLGGYFNTVSWDYIDYIWTGTYIETTNAYYLAENELDKTLIVCTMFSWEFDDEYPFAYDSLFPEMIEYETDFSGDIYYHAALAYTIIRGYDEAIELLEKGVDLPVYYIDKYQYMCNLGTYYICNGDFNNGKEDLLSAYKLNPEDSITLYNLGYCYYMLEDYENATFYLEALIELDPELETAKIASQLIEEMES